MENAKFTLPQWAIGIAVEGLKDLAQRLKEDATSLAWLDTPEAHALALIRQQRLERARKAWKGHEFYIHL